MDDLAARHCRPCQGGTPLGPDEVRFLLPQATGWSLDSSSESISRTYSFRNFHETMAFVNAVAWLAHREDHHPELEVSYRSCRVRYRTHAVGGLSENDFICAAQVNRLVSM
ncbi:MAG: 4a-hydroxytetrahydrobiopterin dehydratase [Polyangiaceae bacterium]|nr:4a-hydroxytetrahydrobiopterin dehydratase [Polyangiaceae bacterium]